MHAAVGAWRESRERRAQRERDVMAQVQLKQRVPELRWQHPRTKAFGRFHHVYGESRRPRCGRHFEPDPAAADDE